MEQEIIGGVMEFHEVANIFPLMNDSEYEELKKDIKENGLIEPIWTHDDKIIDGRNRYLACVDSGIEPKVREWIGKGSLVGFVKSLNLNRRHLNSSQKAVAAAKAMPFYEAEAKKRQINGGGDHGNQYTGGKVADSQLIDQPASKGKATEHAAKEFGTNRQYVSDAKTIKEKAPEKIKEIESGGKTISQAKKEIKEDDNNQEGTTVKQYAEWVAEKRMWKNLPNKITKIYDEIQENGLFPPSKEVPPEYIKKAMKEFINLEYVLKELRGEYTNGRS